MGIFYQTRTHYGFGKIANLCLIRDWLHECSFCRVIDQGFPSKKYAWYFLGPLEPLVDVEMQCLCVGYFSYGSRVFCRSSVIPLIKPLTSVIKTCNIRNIHNKFRNKPVINPVIKFCPFRNISPPLVKRPKDKEAGVDCYTCNLSLEKFLATKNRIFETGLIFLKFIYKC